MCQAGTYSLPGDHCYICVDWHTAHWSQAIPCACAGSSLCVASPVYFLQARPLDVTSNADTFMCGNNFSAPTCSSCASAGLQCHSIATAVDLSNSGGSWEPVVGTNFSFSINFTYSTCLEAKQFYVLTQPGDTSHDRSQWSILVRTMILKALILTVLIKGESHLRVI